MSDDMWRRAEDETGNDEFDDFGELRFSDDDDNSGQASFGSTGEIRVTDDSGVARRSDESDVDIWGSYSVSAPRPIPDRPLRDQTPVSQPTPLMSADDGDDDFGEIRFSDAPDVAPVDFGFSDEPSGPVVRSDSDTSGSRPRIKLGESTSGGRRERGSGALRRPTDSPTGPSTLPMRPTRREDDSLSDLARSDFSRSGEMRRDESDSFFGGPSHDTDFSLDFDSEPVREVPRGTARNTSRDSLRDSSRDSSRDTSRITSREPRRDFGRDPSGPAPREPMFTGSPSTGPMAREPRREPRPSIGPDDLGRPGSGGRPRPPSGRSGPARPARVSRPQEPQSGVAGRDMPTAIAVGLLIAAAFIGALMWKPVAVLALVVLICGLAAIEFFDKVTEKGYRPATIIGILTAVIAPLAGYWVGESALPLVMVFAMITTAFTFVGATGLHSSPIPNMSITSLGVMWIGLMGSYAALLAGVSNVPGLSTAGTDTLFIVAVGVVANDVGALFVGSAAGSTPLRQWISPNKTVEGLMGGTVATLFAMWIVGLQSDTWNDIGEILVLAIAVAILAPLGDLVESMFKRNLEIKDFGTLVKGHGGVLDRFDGFLFVLPAAYYLLRVFEPYAS